MALSFTIKDIYYKLDFELVKDEEVKKYQITISAEEAQKLKELDIELYNNMESFKFITEKLDEMHKIFFKDDLKEIKTIAFGNNFDNLFDEIVVDYRNFTQGEMEKKLKKLQNGNPQRHLKH